MEQAAAMPELADPTRDNFAVLLTDGKQSNNCNNGSDAGTLAAITAMQAAGVSTFVVGFGDGVDPASLDAFANAGGVPNSGPAFYDAGDPAALSAALETIATAAIGCTFSLDEVPPNPDDIAVFFDGTAVAEDGTKTNGFAYDEATNSIEFFGAACDELESGAVTDVDVVLGCPVQ
jgi:hypothetical protein